MDLLRRLAGTSQWQPFTLTRASGHHAGLKMLLRGRGLRVGSETPTLKIVVMQDFVRERSFEEHRRLNMKPAKGSQSETLLANLLEEQRRLHRELVHRVKNNLALLGSLLRLNRQRSDHPEVDRQLEEMERRILSIAAVHELLDSTHETEWVRADELIDRICEELQNSLAPGTVSIERELMPVRLHISDATPLALIINELVTNALKHAFPAGRAAEGRSSTIQIALRKNGIEKLEAVVRDNGVGDLEAVSDAVSGADGAGGEHGLSMPLGAVRPGRADADGSGGTGGRIIQALAMQLNADLTRVDEGGTTWQLVFEPHDIGAGGAGGDIHLG